jgi:metal-sulfur cluster biosynthetic enzyme
MQEQEVSETENGAGGAVRDADAPDAPATPGSGATKEQVLEALRSVYDPELGINIVDLGLVYEVDLNGGLVHITYSLTTMGCPIGPMIEEQMRQFVSAVPGVGEIEAEMVLRPAWSPEMMTDEAKAALGIF